MDIEDRRIIEAIKSATRLTLGVSDGEQSFTVSFQPNKKLHHDIALAYQQTVMDTERKRRRESLMHSRITNQEKAR